MRKRSANTADPSNDSPKAKAATEDKQKATSTSPKSSKNSDPMAIEASLGVTPFAFFWALSLFTFSSVGMMIGNKLAVMHLPLPCTLVILQAVGTLFLLVFCRQHLARVRLDVAIAWLPLAVIFTFMLYTSLRTFLYVSVSTVIIFRNIGAIFTTIVEYLVRGVTVNFQVILAELVIVLGAVMYGHGSVNFSWIGLFFILINVGGQIAYGVLIKAMMDRPMFKEMSKYTMAMYNNLLALPMLIVVMYLQDEHIGVQEKLLAVEPKGWIIIAITCALGFMISTSGFGLQKLVSATTFLVINNLTKFLNIGLGMLFLSDKIAGLLDAGGCLLALGAGFRYSQCMMQLNDQKQAAKAAAVAEKDKAVEKA